MLLILAVLLIAHFVADFPLQSREMALRKSEDVMVLLEHVCIHLGVFLVLASIATGSIVQGLAIAVVNAGLHAVVDWNIWRAFKRYATARAKREHEALLEMGAKPESIVEYSVYEDHLFWVTLGADQLLHGLSIVLAVAISTLI